MADEKDLQANMDVLRNEKVQHFKLELSLDDIPDVPPAPAGKAQTTAEITEEPESIPDKPETAEPEMPASSAELGKPLVPSKPPKTKKPRKKNTVVGKIIYLFSILIISGLLILGVLVFLFDCLAIGRESRAVDVEIPKGATTEQIATMLQEKGLIDRPLLFRLFSRFTGADGTYQQGAFILKTDMGYMGIVETLQTMEPRDTVTVTIPEGLTVEEIAELLDEKGACDKNSFYEAVNRGVFDYDFVREIPDAADGEEYAGRIYRLEGYLFPDTYNFYTDSSGETVVGKMLENFNKKLTPELREAITAKGWTIDQAIIIASLVEGEAAKEEDMYKVSKVLANRMTPDSGYAKLELCSTRDYVKAILPSMDGVAVTSIAYNTYEREGLPVGAINNPGLMALKAALNPSTDPSVAKCYFFATDYNTGITYFSDTFKEHERICRKYKIGMYG